MSIFRKKRTATRLITKRIEEAKEEKIAEEVKEEKIAEEVKEEKIAEEVKEEKIAEEVKEEKITGIEKKKDISEKDTFLRDLCLKLVNANTEKEMKGILKQAGYWDNSEAWRYYGDNENNFATVGNQQNSPDTALVEKIINSVDAVLMRECLREGINPEGPDAPKSMREALEYFFEIKNGVLTNVNTKKRSELAQNIVVVATGEKSNPCYSIIDKGEGQIPPNFPQTFMSLIKSNKLRIPFVQGKFNMGGTGTLQFCGNRNIQLIISKRCPDIIKKRDDLSDYWGFTVVRREDPIKGMRSSAFKYLAPDNNILMFKADSLPLLPGDYPVAYENPLEWGTFIKLYEYQLIGLKSPVSFDLYYRLSLLLPNIALPVILYERRPGYAAQSYYTILSGLSVRLEEDKYDNIEDGYPSSSTIKIKGQEMKVQLYVFKKDKKRHYARDDGIVFTVNGQSHGFISKSFFTRKTVGMSYLADSIILLVDCSNFDGRIREDLFMNSRERLRSGELKNEIEEKLEDLLKNHPGLRELKEKRRREEIEGKIADPEQVVIAIEKVIKSSPSLSRLFVEGVKITNPFKLSYTGVKEGEYKGKIFPTFFIPKGSEFTKEKPKHCPINQRFRVQYETDAENNYFTRDSHPGNNKLSLIDGKKVTDYILNIWNGIANLTIQLPEDSKIGDLIEYSLEINDISRSDPFLSKFFVIVDPAIEKGKGGKGERIGQPDDLPGDKRKRPNVLEVPSMKEVFQDQWKRYDFDRESGLKVIDSGDDGYDFYINMDNIYLLTEIKGRINVSPDILKLQYKYGMILIGLSLIKSFEGEKGEESISEKIGKITRAISPVLLPMISSLNELETE